MIIITSSRRPSRRTRSFIRELVSVIPNTIKITRGKRTLQELLLVCLEVKAKTLILVLEKRGNPSALLFYLVDQKNNVLLKKLMLKLKGLKLWRELDNAVRPYNPSSIAIDASNIGSGLAELLAEKLALFLGCKLVFNREELLEYDVVIRMLEKEEYCELRFINPSTLKNVGPLLKIFGAVEYE